MEIQLNISTEAYSTKEACNNAVKAHNPSEKMKFREQKVTLDQFVEYALKGYTFSGLYRFDKKIYYKEYNGIKYPDTPYYKDGSLKMTFRTNEFFYGTQVIFIDIDDTKYESVTEYIDTLTYTPTVCYMSYSDKKEKEGKVSRRFHLCYVFKEILDQMEFREISGKLSDQLEKDTGEVLQDKCGTRMNQYFNGCATSQECYRNFSYVYSASQFDIKLPYEKTSQKVSVPQTNEEEKRFVDTLLKDWDKLPKSVFPFSSKCWTILKNECQYIYRSGETGDWYFGQFQYLDRERPYVKLTFYGETRLDGQKRRKDLFKRMCLRRLIKPEITLRELLYNAMCDIMYHYDNSDNALTGNFLLRNAQNALKLTQKEIEKKYRKSLEYMENLRPVRGKIYKKGQYTREATYSALDGLYDVNMTVRENWEFLNEEIGYYVSVKTLYRYVKDRSIDIVKRGASNEEIMECIDLKMTPHKNYIILKDSGLRISKDKLYKLYNNKLNNL